MCKVIIPGPLERARNRFGDRQRAQKTLENPLPPIYNLLGLLVVRAVKVESSLDVFVFLTASVANKPHKGVRFL